MRASKYLPSTLGLLLMCVSGHAQTSRTLPVSEAPAASPAVQVNPAQAQPVILPAPPVLYAGNPQYTRPTLLTLELRPADTIKSEDRALLESRTGEIDKAIAFYAFNPKGEGWNVQQILCPSMPAHVLLRYQRPRKGQGGGEDVVGVAVPRGQGTVEAIPVVRRSATLFDPTPGNSITTGALTRILQQELEQGSDPVKLDWLTTGLCMAELNGAHPTVILSARSNDEMFERNAQVPVVAMENDSVSMIEFSDVANARQTVLWTFHFVDRDRLASASSKGMPPGRIERFAATPAAVATGSGPGVQPVPANIPARP